MRGLTPAERGILTRLLTPYQHWESEADQLWTMLALERAGRTKRIAERVVENGDLNVTFAVAPRGREALRLDTIARTRITGDVVT